MPEQSAACSGVCADAIYSLPPGSVIKGLNIQEQAAEMDEMWSFYHDKSHRIWLWWAVDHKTNTPLSYTFGTREYKYFDGLLELLSGFHFITNDTTYFIVSIYQRP